MSDDRIDMSSRTADGMAYGATGDLAAVRAFVRSAALAGGLAVEKAELLVLAVSELAANTLQHTTDGGRVRVWRDDGDVVCEVSDSGVVAGDAHSFGDMPAAEARGGRGLAIVKRVVDKLSLRVGATGTIVELRMAT